MNLSRLLDSIHTEYVPIVINSKQLHLIISTCLKNFKKSPVYLGLDPLTHNLENAVTSQPAWQLARQLPLIRAKVHNDGGTEAQELAHFASSVAYCLSHFWGRNIQAS